MFRYACTKPARQLGRLGRCSKNVDKVDKVDKLPSVFENTLALRCESRSATWRVLSHMCTMLA